MSSSVKFFYARKSEPGDSEFDEELRRDPGNPHALVRRGEARLLQENVEAALQDWEKAIAIDVEQTERLLGLREAGFGDSALEQLTDATREKIQKLAGDLQDRNSQQRTWLLRFSPNRTELFASGDRGYSCSFHRQEGRCRQDLHRSRRRPRAPARAIF